MRNYFDDKLLLFCTLIVMLMSFSINADERGWQINEKIEVGNVELKRRSDALMKKEKGGSVWIDLFTFSGVPMKVEGGKQDNEIEEDINNDGKKSNEEEIEEEEEVDKEEKENDGEEVDEENEEERDEEDKDETEDNEDEEDNEGNVGEDGKENEDEEDDNNDKDDNELDPTLSITDKKRMCRYRLSCYADKGIKIPGKYGGKEQRQENGEYIPSGKRTLGGTKLKIVDVEKKATLKDAAKQAVKKVRQQEAEGEVLREKYVYDGERVLADFWAELERKNRCKYRRSCYLSGKLPEIKQSEILQWLGSFGNLKGWWGVGMEGKQKIDKDEGKQTKLEYKNIKLACKYRKSCYEGIENNRETKIIGVKKETILAIKSPPPPPTINWTTINPEKCNKWRISCRQVLGLPIKEKAPIGPNGKRLCRKKKEEEIIIKGGGKAIK
uniref:Uncharacterized protein n=1 Tax=Meloidogyne javanica TaxID=6303 RepID=A0A915MA70_MELJA